MTEADGTTARRFFSRRSFTGGVAAAALAAPAALTPTAAAAAQPGRPALRDAATAKTGGEVRYLTLYAENLPAGGWATASSRARRRFPARCWR